MTDRPIIFSAPMVRALLDGRKSQTRRVLKPQPFPVGGPFYRPFEKTDPCLWYSVSAAGTVANIQKVPYAPGDRLYVREAWRAERGQDRQNATEIAAACLDAGYSRVWCPTFYEVDAERVDFENGMVAGRYRHARFMPRWASRITLTVTEVRVQRLQEISTEDAIAEGISLPWVPGGTLALMAQGSAKDAYRDLWNSLHGPDAWDANPWIVVVSFTTRKGNIDTPSAESASAARGEEG